jgi:lambda family phage portal protein
MGLQSLIGGAARGLSTWAGGVAERMDGVGEGRTGETYPVAYRGATLQTQETYAWRPPFTSGESSTLYDRFLANVRARDLVRNDPHAAAIVMRLVDMLVGAGLRLTPSPNARALGLDPTNLKDRATIRTLAQQIKTEWDLILKDPARNSDAQRRLSLNGQFRMAARTFATLDEATGYLSFKDRAGARYKTCLRLVDPDRLSNPMGQPDTIRLRGGIEFDADGEPLAYHVRNGHPADWFRFAQILEWTRIERTTSWGRPVFIHAFEPEREDQSRAITPFSSLMTRLRMITKFAETELASATVNALFAAFVYSNMPVTDATQAFTPAGTTFAEKRQKFYEKNPARLNGVRVPVMEIGDEIKMNNAPRQTASFESFYTAFLRSVASARGLTYEQVSMDWSKTNYSSARAALNEMWRTIQRLFSVFVDQLVTPVYYAFVEEAFDRGYITAPAGAPDFWDLPAAYLDARWIGPGRGYVDPVKEAEGATARMGALMSTLERECAEQGFDWEDVLDQAALEAEEIKSRGLSRIIAAPGHIADDPSDKAGEAEADAGKKEDDAT